MPLRPEYEYFTTINNNPGFRYFYYDIGNMRLYPLNIIIHLGLVLSVGLLVYFLRKSDRRNDLLFLPPVLAYIVFFLFFFRQNPSIRYLFPIIPFLAVVAGKVCAQIKKKWVIKTIIAGVILQFVFTNAHVFFQRQISLAEKQTYCYVTDNIPEGAHIMCSENKLALYTRRITFWVSYCSLVEAAYLFWNAEESEGRQILDRYKIGYILVEKSRIYDDSVSRHLGGYPASFLAKIKTWSSVKKIFENSSAEIYKI